MQPLCTDDVEVVVSGRCGCARCWYLLRTCCNSWNVLIIGMQDFNYLICSSLLNEWISKKLTILIVQMGNFYSVLFSPAKSSRLRYQLLRPGNLQSAFTTLHVRVELFTIMLSMCSLISFSSMNLPSVRVYDLNYLNWPLILGDFASDMFWKLMVSVSIIHVIAVCMLKGVPIITTGSLKSRKNGNPEIPLFMGCVST